MSPGAPRIPHRLPTTVVPTAYDTHITATPDRERFHGRVTIDVDLREDTDRIQVHARELEIEAVRITAGDMELTGHTKLDAKTETAMFRFRRGIPAGPAKLEVEYTGRVSRGMAGLYLSKDGDEVCLATQCEATDARAILPCFDEPAFKARFAWTITTDASQTVLANTPLQDRTEDADSGMVTWRFAPTQRMSSYLCAFAIGEFAGTDEVVERDVPFKVYALGGKEKLGVHARDFAARLLPWFEDYFDAPYHFDKYDQVAVPSFSFGAMENVGLVVFRASLLLMDDRTASWDQVKAIDKVVAHEFAHMWFGNLVTMSWWDDLWLNEAFAEWIAHRVVDELEPDHEVWMDFKRRTNQALGTDALQRTHAIYHPVETPEEATEMFDSITYGKGSAVMRMLEAYLGQDAFRDGLRTYMQEFAEDNAAGADLWRHLEEASDEPVGAIMESWIEQPGHPVVSARADVVDGLMTLHLEQSRHRSSPLSPETKQTWDIPMVVRFEDASGVQEHRHVLSSTEDTLEVPVDGPVKWLVLNAEDVGFYRADPDDAMLDALIENYDALSPAERIGLLRDQWDLVRAGTRSVTRYLDLLDAVVTGQDHHAVVEHAVGHIGRLERWLDGHDEQEALAALREWTRELFRDAWEELGVEVADDDPPQTRARRADVLQAMAAIARDQDALDAVLGLARSERNDASSVDADLAGPPPAWTRTSRARPWRSTPSSVTRTPSKRTWPPTTPGGTPARRPRRSTAT